MNFEEVVIDSIKSLPKHIRKMMDNVVICIEDDAEEKFLLGLYEGVPKTAWGRGSTGELPDKITIFKKPIFRVSQNKEEVKKIIKETVYHEVAHHFGFTEEEVKRWEKHGTSRL